MKRAQVKMSQSIVELTDELSDWDGHRGHNYRGGEVVLDQACAPHQTEEPPCHVADKWCIFVGTTYIASVIQMTSKTAVIYDTHDSWDDRGVHICRR